MNLFYGGVGDKQAGQYSGGMKRRLSVAISLIGDPKVYIASNFPSSYRKKSFLNVEIVS